MSALTLTQVKEYLRYETADTSNDNTLTIMLAGAQRWVENYTGHILVQREVVESPAAFPVAPTGQTPYFDLRWKPADSTTIEIGYLDSDLEAATFTAFTSYLVNDTYRVVANVAWPTTGSGITFTYTAGYEAVDDIPDDIMHAMLIYLGMSDDDRAETNAMGWKALDSILQHYRLPVLA